MISRFYQFHSIQHVSHLKTTTTATLGNGTIAPSRDSGETPTAVALLKRNGKERKVLRKIEIQLSHKQIKWLSQVKFLATQARVYEGSKSILPNAMCQSFIVLKGGIRNGHKMRFIRRWKCIVSSSRI